MHDQIKGRLAPSPTGAQHLGNARTYLAAWLSARSRGGTLVLRIEDIDSPRVKPGAAEQAIDDLRWLGLDWDEGPIYQTARLARYAAAFDQLQQAELVYPCTCTRTDVERAASAPHGESAGAVHAEPAYPGTCAGRRVADAAGLRDRVFAWRLRAAPALWSYVDGLLGPTALDLEKLGGDFIVWKSSGTPAYQLAVVVDDHEMGVTEVMRGDDLVPSTARQLLLYHRLGWTPPVFTHVPLVVGPDGRRLAKRHGDTRLSTLRDAGITAEDVIGLLGWSCGWLDSIRPISAHELLSSFTLAAVPRVPFVLTQELLTQIAPRHG
ncbi:MAG: tRNA glutamyl-Q(34) synthetase GluQRS [Planctomycetes bacterium]|nr:tRNA glutamyl-Q(34) synthetase GluQRS [Planctomycetota bacterium]